MTQDEKRLLLEVARWVADQEEKLAGDLNTTSNWALTMRRLIEKVRQTP